MPRRTLAALILLLGLAACASDDARSFAHAYPYDSDYQAFEGMGYEPDEESMAGINIRGVIDDSLGLPGGNVY